MKVNPKRLPRHLHREAIDSIRTPRGPSDNGLIATRNVNREVGAAGALSRSALSSAPDKTISSQSRVLAGRKRRKDKDRIKYL